MSETKRLHFTSSSQGIATGVNYNRTAVNLFQPFVNGDNVGDVIGTEIDVRYLELRYRAYHTSQSGYDMMTPVWIRFTVVKTPAVWALGSPTAPFVPEANIPPNVTLPTGTSMPIVLSKFNSDAVKVLWQKKVVVPRAPYTPGASTNAAVKIGKIKPKGYKGKKNFMAQWSSDVGNALGQTRQGQFYLVIDMWMQNAAAATHNFIMNYDWSMYYKDI